MALEIMKNGLAKNKIRGPFRPRGEGGQDEMVPGPFQNTFLFSNPSLSKMSLLFQVCIYGCRYYLSKGGSNETLDNL